MNFASKQFGAKTAAVMFDVSNDYSKGLADIFRVKWEEKHGKGTVVAFESHGTKDQDFSAQLTKLLAAKPDFIFLPENYNKPGRRSAALRHGMPVWPWRRSSVRLWSSG